MLIKSRRATPAAPHPRAPFSASMAFPTSGALQLPLLLCISDTYRGRYGWRHQIGPWVRAGYRVIAPDMLGYGGTDKPRAAEEYSMRRLCADLAAILDVVGVHKAVSARSAHACDCDVDFAVQIVIGHDWGSFTAARFALWHPNRLLALAL